jgi:hypothetical protein
LLGDESKRSRECRLTESSAGLQRLVVRIEDGLAVEPTDILAASAERREENAVHDEALIRESDGRLQHVTQWHRAELPERGRHACHGAGYARRLVTDDAFVCELAVRPDVHVARRGERRDLSIVHGGSAAIGHPDHHVPAATEITGERERHGECESGRDGGVHGIPTARMISSPAALASELLLATIESGRTCPVARLEAPLGREGDVWFGRLPPPIAGSARVAGGLFEVRQAAPSAAPSTIKADRAEGPRESSTSQLRQHVRRVECLPSFARSR